MNPTVRQVLDESRKRLVNVDSPALSAEVLIGHVLGVQRFALHLDINRRLDEGQVQTIRALVERRATGEPVAYLVGVQEFYGLDFMVTPHVLIPRPETEHIIERCQELFHPDQGFLFADFGTGSGILAVTLAVLFPNARGVAVDMHAGALEVARTNAKRHGVASRLGFVRADFTSPLLHSACIDLVVSNPPYVTSHEYARCSAEVRDFEPQTALTSGADGLHHIRGLIPGATHCLTSGGWFLMEFGWRQGRAVEKLLESRSELLDNISVNRDYSGHDRFVVARKK